MAMNRSIVPYGVTITVVKGISVKCGCGKHHGEIPKGSKYVDYEDCLSGWYFDCSCRSTHYVPKDFIALNETIQKAA